MSQVPLPPGVSETDLLDIPVRDRDDAIQEAWVAHLEGLDALGAAVNYARREKYYRKTRRPGIPNCGQ